MRHWLAIGVHRNPNDKDILDYEVRLYWEADAGASKKMRTSGGRRVAQGSFICLEPISDVEFVLTELAHHVSIVAQGPGDAPRSPGRERSGVDNVPTLEQLPLAPQEQSAPTTEELPPA